MNRYISRLLLAVLISSLLLLGCGGDKDASKSKLPSDPVEALKEINKTGRDNYSSAHFTMDMVMDMDAQGFAVKMEMDAEGDVEMKGPTPQDANMYMKMDMSMLGQEMAMEMIALEGLFWMREGEGEWQQVPAEQANITGGLGGDTGVCVALSGKRQECQETRRRENRWRHLFSLWLYNGCRRAWHTGNVGATYRRGRLDGRAGSENA